MGEDKNLPGMKCSDFTSKSSLVFCEDVPASLHYAEARKKTFGFE